MNKPVKAVLLSALIFPGAGHYFLRCYVSAGVFCLVSAAALYVLISGLMDRALVIVNEIQQHGAQVDVGAISVFVTQQLNGSDGGSASTATMVLVIFWLTSIADAYRIGSNLERSANSLVKRKI